MKLLESIPCKKGITLNVQLVDLLSILDEPISQEEQDKKIIEYIENIRIKERENAEASEKGIESRYSYVLDEIIETPEGMSEEDKKRLKSVYLSSVLDFSVCDKKKILQILEQNGFDSSTYEDTIRNIGDMQFSAKEGVLTLTPEKVRAFYSHLFEGGNRYDRVTFDNAGKYSDYVFLDGETYTHERVGKMLDFCEKHGMQGKINTLMFYADFPKVYEASLEARVKSGEITEEQKKQMIKQALINYAKDVGTRYGDRVDTIDIFNELIYDPVMKEPGFDEEPTFHTRREGWQKYLNIEDLCEMALEARKVMPNVTFTYNDMNWVEPEKRKKIIEIIKQIQAIQERYKQEGKLGPDETLIDTIGIEAHLTTGVDLDEIDRTFEDIQREIGLPMEVTEFDVARTGKNPMSPEEIKKQGKIFERFMRIAQTRPNLVAFTIWSQSDELSFMNEKCGRMVYASVLDSNFEEKDFELSKEFVPQDFNYHTHTALCGHAEGEIEEYVEKAIQGGITSLGFSDHTPNPLGKSDPRSAMQTEQFYSEYIPILEALREKYADRINIKIGLEAEYFGAEIEELNGEIPEKMIPYAGLIQVLKNFRAQTGEKLDYMILGQHSVLARDEQGKIKMPPTNSEKTSKNYPLDYARTVVEAIKSGKFAYVAHPDIFLESRDKVPEAQREEYMKNAMLATEMICEVAREYQIPLEVNLGSISAIESGKKQRLSDGSYAYPVPAFWRIAQEKGCKVLIGTDVHEPQAFVDKRMERIAKEMLEGAGIELDYLDSFEPKGIGRETMQTPVITGQDVVKAFAGRSVLGKENAQKQIAAEERTSTEKEGQAFNED